MDFDSYARRLWAGRADAYEHGFARLTAVDAEPSMAEAAARNVPGPDVRVAVLPDLPLAAAGFDAVTGSGARHRQGGSRGGRGVLAAGHPGADLGISG
jgi:hypothetical protein